MTTRKPEKVIKTARCSSSNPHVNEMLIKIAKENRIPIGTAGPNCNNSWPYIFFDGDLLSQCSSTYYADAVLNIDEFIDFLNKHKSYQTTFGGHNVLLNANSFKVGCNEFSISETKKIVEFLNKHLKEL